jgi:hypothetical protein
VDAARIVMHVLMMPGIVLHELAHACGCVLTSTEIHHIQFWQWPNYLDWEADDQRAGVVRHDKPYKPWYGVFISALPLPVCFSCGALLYVLADILAYRLSLLSFALGTTFMYCMGLSKGDVANIERYTAALTGFEAWIRDVFVRVSRSEGLHFVSVPIGAILLLDLSLWLVVPAFIWHLFIEAVFWLYDWWQTR